MWDGGGGRGMGGGARGTASCSLGIRPLPHSPPFQGNHPCLKTGGWRPAGRLANCCTSKLLETHTSNMAVFHCANVAFHFRFVSVT